MRMKKQCNNEIMKFRNRKVTTGKLREVIKEIAIIKWLKNCREHGVANLLFSHKYRIFNRNSVWLDSNNFHKTGVH